MTAATRKRRFRRRAGEVARVLDAEGVERGIGASGISKDEVAERVADALAEEALVCLPTLVSRTTTAELLGVHKANIGRYEEQIKPFEVEVDGARAPVYVKSGIEALAKTLHR